MRRRKRRVTRHSDHVRLESKFAIGDVAACHRQNQEEAFPFEKSATEPILLLID